MKKAAVLTLSIIGVLLIVIIVFILSAVVSNKMLACSLDQANSVQQQAQKIESRTEEEKMQLRLQVREGLIECYGQVSSETYLPVPLLKWLISIKAVIGF